MKNNISKNAPIGAFFQPLITLARINIFHFTRGDLFLIGQKEKNIHQETLELYNMGFSINVIAANRELKPSTILSHLFKLKEEGNAIDLRKLIADDVFDAISEGIRIQGFTQESKLREIYEYFEEKYSYDEIRIVMIIVSED